MRLGRKVERETRHFDEVAKTTRTLRKKEFEEDYGYIFDPDLPVLDISDEWKSKIEKGMPELPDTMVKRFSKQYGIGDYDAKVIVYTGRDFASFFEDVCRIYSKPKAASRWMINYLLKSLNWRSERISQSRASPDTFSELLAMIDKGEITERYAKEIIKEYVDTGFRPSDIASRSGPKPSLQGLRDIVKKVIKDNTKAASEFAAGKNDALAYLIGAVLKETGKRGDPKEIAKMIKKEISNASVAQ